MKIIHTSENESGQIYIPVVNWTLYFAVVLVIVSFQHSSNLAAAYRIAVTGTMVLTGFLICTVALKNWNWHPVCVAGLLFSFLIIDVPFFSANIMKFFSGGWLPITLGLVNSLL